MIPFHRVTAEPGELLDQAGKTSEVFLDAAIEAIDAKFGNGFARATPELVAAFMLTSSIDFTSAMLFKFIGEAIDTITGEDEWTDDQDNG